ncbi:hypothetical protein [Gulosibacter sp. 10]|uniref:hypothetical protein n=1 Tax=Gulosibacter sp. 10 TaxID=1255570 RepID=UPI00097EC5BC|nr:hypothetical protein [Gulosibacter sp. 10]SJM59453.1 hypothetical protein FM112_06510 [Gulosibacter sp. 10]
MFTRGDLVFAGHDIDTPDHRRIAAGTPGIVTTSGLWTGRITVEFTVSDLFAGCTIEITVSDADLR